MNITLSIDENLVREVEKIALERGTTLNAMIQEYLGQLAAEHAKSDRTRQDLEALEKSFDQIQIDMGERTWKREDLYDRPSRRDWSNQG